MLDCARAIGIERANVCRYVADLVNNGKVEKLYKGIDKTTKARAYYYGATEEKKGGAVC
jgi:predicted transcriptional regulator